MKRITYLLLTVFALLSSSAFLSCKDSETYAELKDKEKKYIDKFLADNHFVGKINVITESQFCVQDSTTDVDNNEFVLFEDKGVYMQIVRKGEGSTMVEMAKQTADSTISKVLLCRFLEYDIENADTTYSNIYVSAIVDKMLCKYSHRGRSYSASFTEGYMATYHEATVPSGWLKPLDYIRLTKDTGKIAKVRLIVPHSSGTLNASGHVFPYYYEITYQLGK